MKVTWKPPVLALPVLPAHSTPLRVKRLPHRRHDKDDPFRRHLLGPPNSEPVAAPRGSGSRGRNPRAGRNPTRSLGPMASQPRMPRGAPHHRPRRNADHGGRVTREHPDREPGEAPAVGVFASALVLGSRCAGNEERARRYRLHADTPSNRATTAGNVARAPPGVVAGTVTDAQTNTPAAGGPVGRGGCVDVPTLSNAQVYVNRPRAVRRYSGLDIYF